MAIEGPLKELAFTDVLQLLDLSRKTGVLSVFRDENDTPARIWIDEGMIVGVHTRGHTRRLDELLLLAGKATQGQIDRAIRRQTMFGGRLIGAYLEEEGVSAAEIRKQLRFQIEELVFDLVRWTEGHFRFEESEVEESAGISVRVATESLLMEGMRRMDEWAELSRTSPDSELVPTLVEVQQDSVLELDPVEWEILAAVDSERSLRDIALEVGRGEFEVAKGVFGLVSAGVVEIGTRRFSRRAEQGRGNSGEEGAGAESGAAPGEPGRAALREGLAAARQARWMAAADAFSRVVASDPLYAEGYYHLGVAAVRTGDIERAEEAFRTFLRLDETQSRQHVRASRAANAIAELKRVLHEEGR